MLETKAVLTGLFYTFGIPVYILGILGNLGTWKGDILFVLGGLIMLARLIYYVIDKEQIRRKKNIDLERHRYELDKQKENNP